METAFESGFHIYHPSILIIDGQLANMKVRKASTD
jgi:hypothetical protein